VKVGVGDGFVRGGVKVAESVRKRAACYAMLRNVTSWGVEILSAICVLGEDQ